MDGDFFAFQINTFYHASGANNLWLCFAHGFMMMFVSLGIKANNGKQTEHCDLQCFFHLFSPGVKNYCCQPPPKAVYKEISLT